MINYLPTATAYVPFPVLALSIVGLTILSIEEGMNWDYHTPEWNSWFDKDQERREGKGLIPHSVKGFKDQVCGFLLARFLKLVSSCPALEPVNLRSKHACQWDRVIPTSTNAFDWFHICSRSSQESNSSTSSKLKELTLLKVRTGLLMLIQSPSGCTALFYSR